MDEQPPGPALSASQTPTVRYRLLLVACWFGGEILGAIGGAVLLQVVHLVLPHSDESMSVMLIYAGALLGAIGGALIPFRMVARRRNLMNVESERWTCEQCGEAISLAASACPMCGAIRVSRSDFAGLDDRGGPQPPVDFGVLDSQH